MELPTAKEINVHDSVDERRACKNFLGKSDEEAEALFRENALFYCEDLMWMGPAAFRFYIKAAIRYVQSEAASGDADAINCIAGLFNFRLEREPAEIAPVAAELVSACNYIIEHYEKFNAEPEIYGDLRGRFRKLQQAFSQMINHGSKN